MDEKLQHFVALLNERRPPPRTAPRPVSVHPPRGRRVVIPAGLASLALAVAAAGWWVLAGRVPEPAPPLAAPVVAAGSTPAAPVPVVPPVATVTPATTQPPAVADPASGASARGDEASLAPSTATPPGPESDTPPSAGVVPPAELASRPPDSVRPEPPPGVPPWQRYAVAAPSPNGEPRVVLVIDDMGVDRKRSERAVALPGPLTLSYLPYANDLPHQTEAAHRAGHELMVHIPMEPFGHVSDAWSDQLEVSLSHDEVLRRLRWDLSRFNGYVGINNHMGSRFTSDEEALRPVIEELRARGLLFLDSRTAPHSFGVPLARDLGVPHAGRDVFLDDEITVPAIEAQLAEFERVAKRNGIAIAIGHPHDPTLTVLETWLKTLPQKGLQLVPLSAVVRARAGVAG